METEKILVTEDTSPGYRYGTTTGRGWRRKRLKMNGSASPARKAPPVPMFPKPVVCAVVIAITDMKINATRFLVNMVV
uniref:Uncharacterized protein n=1 Tax=Magallana gigas TaxID=29159 RepID=K1QWA3_MAGGI